MGAPGFYTRVAAGLLVAQIALAGAVYFLWQNSYLDKSLASFRAKANLNAAWTDFYKDQRLWGYVDRHSILPGERFDLMLSVKPGRPELDLSIKISRLTGGPSGLTRELVWQGDNETIKAQQMSLSAASAGANWNINYIVDSGADWRSGVYVVDALGADGVTDENVALFVVRPAKPSGDILVKISGNAVQAQNPWGGGSLAGASLFADQGAMASFDRPSAPSLMDAEIYFLIWIENLARDAKLDVGYISDFDLHQNPALMDGYKLFISGGRDDYWTREMFDAVENRIFKQGKNVAFLGANSAHWQVRYADIDAMPGAASRGRQIIAYRNSDDPIASRFGDPRQAAALLTKSFRWQSRRPETMLTGIAAQEDFEADASDPGADYTVIDATLPLFDGTGWKNGDQIANIIGGAWGNRDPLGDGKRLWDQALSLNPKLPAENIKLLFSGSPIGRSGGKGLAEAVFWQSPAGAKVFSAGSLHWAWGLGRPGVESEDFKRFNRNLIAAMLK